MSHSQEFNWVKIRIVLHWLTSGIQQVIGGRSESVDINVTFDCPFWRHPMSGRHSVLTGLVPHCGIWFCIGWDLVGLFHLFASDSLVDFLDIWFNYYRDYLPVFIINMWGLHPLPKNGKYQMCIFNYTCTGCGFCQGSKSLVYMVRFVNNHFSWKPH